MHQSWDVLARSLRDMMLGENIFGLQEMSDSRLVPRNLHSLRSAWMAETPPLQSGNRKCV